MDKHKKRAAAISAVVRYLKSEEEILAARQSAQIPAAPVRQIGISVWGISGRQYQMQMRQLMQIKTFHGTRFR
ncbi:MAG: hypothetical protein R6U50_14840 [Desulfobacterales bacterium]